MIKLIVKLLIALPSLGALFVSIRTAYVMELADRRYAEHLALVAELRKPDNNN